MAKLTVCVKMQVEGQVLQVPVANALVKAMVVVVGLAQESAQGGKKSKPKDQSMIAFHETRTDENGEIILFLEPGKTYQISASGLGGYDSEEVLIPDGDHHPGSDLEPLVLVLDRAISLIGY